MPISSAPFIFLISKKAITSKPQSPITTVAVNEVTPLRVALPDVLHLQPGEQTRVQLGQLFARFGVREPQRLGEDTRGFGRAG